ncbi:MAG: CoB--CoM heterodisulfide reductase iron-sulfur subunit A family protein [Desulfobacteraceae bacterium]|jgi:heterodisulfide reductase subunit A
MSMMTQLNTQKRGSVMIVGGGIGGMQASLDLADSGYKVHIIQKESSIGGTMVMLDKTFPTGDCSMCMISPKMVEVARHPNIEVHTLSSVTSVTGVPGDFKVRILQKPRYVKMENCTGCGLCEEKCPKKTSSEFEQNLAVRKAIYCDFSQAVPNTRVIDSSICLYLTKGKCRICEKVCTAKAIDFEDKGKEFDLDVGAVILSPGLKRHNPALHQELGFGRWKNVVTSLQFERILSASGPFSGEIQRPSDKKHPEKIAWLQCVGSRDPHNANPWCSSVCCMYATKQAVIAKEHDKNVKPSIFYMDMRAFGKDFDKYVDRAKNEYNVAYHRSMISDVREDPETGDLIVRYTNDEGKLTYETFDMVVLSIGLEPHSDVHEFAKTFGIELNEHGFAKTSVFSPVESSKEGIYVTGTFQSPKDIPETVMQGSAVAGTAMCLLGEVRGSEVVEPVLPPEKDISQDEPRIGVIVCHCGINISQTVDVKKIADDAKSLPGVTHSEDMMYACAQDSQDKIKKLIQEKNLNRIVVASCTPRTHAPLFQETIREAGLNKYLFELADIREQCSWCHMGENEMATKKAGDIVRMNIAKVNRFEPIVTDSVPVTPSALVIGAGIAGMTSALSLAEQGFAVHLIEKENAIGGLLKKVHRTIEAEDVQDFLRKRMYEVEKHPKITIHTGTTIKKSEGFVGNFKTTLSDESQIEHGAVIVATGGEEYKPIEYGYGENRCIITQRDLEKQLEDKGPTPGSSYVMIQCVGSREEPTNYCSRICCQDAIKNAISIKEKDPGVPVTIIFRDMRTYGLREDYYRKARDLGVMFVRYEPDNKPQVTPMGRGLSITTYDHMLRSPITLQTDYLVLSTGLRPHPASEDISKRFKLTRNAEGFFLEAHVKLRPVDFPSEGFFVAGLAHAPKNIDETISQALSAAGRAGVLLSHDRLGVSGIISKHNRDLCMSCLACFRVCPFDSPFIDEDGKVSHNEVKCTGCGICSGICPAKAFQVNNFRDDQMIAMIDALTENIA